MAGPSSIHEDGSFLSLIDRCLFRLESLLALIGGGAILFLMLLAVVSVSGRNFFNQPVPGYVDWIEQAMPIIAFVGIAYCQRLGGHIRMDMLVGQLKGRALWCVEFIGVFLMFIVMLLMIWGSWAHFERSFGWDAPYWSHDSSFDIRLPLWPAKLLVPTAFFVMALRLVLQLWGYGRALLTGDGAPVAVPLIEDASTIAAKEAMSVSGFDNHSPQDRRGG